MKPEVILTEINKFVKTNFFYIFLILLLTISLFYLLIEISEMIDEKPEIIIEDLTFFNIGGL